MTTNSLMIDRLRQRMNEVGVNPKQLAEKAQVGKTFVYDILNGKSKNPTTAKLGSISRYLGIPLSYLVSTGENNVDVQKYTFVYPLLKDIANKEPSMLILSSMIRNKQENDMIHSFNINDDSMEPTFHNGDLLIVNISRRKQDPVGIFVIKDEFSTTVRRVEHIIGSAKLRVIADNSKYSTYEQEMAKVQLIGKIVWYIRAM